MRISTFFLFLCVFSSFASKTVSQNAKVNIKGSNLTIAEFIDQIENQTDYLFVYSKNEVNPGTAIELNTGEKTVAQCLTEAFQDSEVKYAFENDYIVLTKNAIPSIAQQGKKVSGTVKDNNGEPIIGANVVVKGTTNGTITDYDGNFNLQVPDDAILQITYIGYLSKEIPVGNQTTINVLLLEDTQALDEIVVVGYGVQRKSDVTGSIAVSKGEDLLKQQSFSALDGLKGKASGVNIFANSGQPGGASRVIIRGTGTINSNSDPLYVVDGVVMEDFKYMNPNDIERIEVLKDASSAAIYGARGANGVILVTTKRGLKGGGVSITYNGSVSMSSVPKYMDVMNSDEWMQAFKIGLENANKYQNKNRSTDLKDYFTDPRLFDANGKPLYDTDWQKEATRTAWSHNHQLSIQQGNQESSVGAFLNYTDQQGVMLNSYMKRVNAKLTYDAKPTTWLSTAVNVLVNHTWANEAEEEGGHQMPRRSMIEMVPWMPVKLDGVWTNAGTVTDALGLEGMANPVHVLTTQERMRYRTQVFGNAELTFHLAPGLDLQTRLGVDAHFRQWRDYSPTDLANISSPHGRALIEDQRMYYWQEETFLTYNKTFEKHRVNAMAGLSWQERVYKMNKSETEGFSDDFYGNNNMGVGTLPKSPTSEYSKWAMNSYFLRGSYTYNDRYSATVTGRVDGSSRFGENNKYAFFPSAGLAWVASNEDFMQDLPVINNLKFHTSYGVTGNTEIGTYQSLAMMGVGTFYLNDGRVGAAWQDRMPNPDLKWEKTHQFDFGVEVGLFDNRVNLDVSYYEKKTKDLIMPRPLPRSTGFNSVLSNIGQISNRGIDLLINTTNIQTNDFTWGTTLNLNYNTNKIDKLGENDEDVFEGPNWVSGYQTILRVGESLSSFYGYERLGFWTEEDKANGLMTDAQIVGQAKRSETKKILGKGLPDFTGSFINNFRYKNLDLTVDFQFVLGVDVLQQFTHSTEDRFGLTNGEKSVLYDAWSPSNPNAKVQAIRNAALQDGQNSELDSRWVADGSYLRANLIQLGYTFDSKLINPLKALRIYAGVNNAFVITSSDFRGYDPEGTSQGTNQFGQNMFFFQYPKPRTFTLGLTATF